MAQKARVLVSMELLHQFLQFPQNTRIKHGWFSPPHYIELVIEGEGLPAGPEMQEITANYVNRGDGARFAEWAAVSDG